MTSQVNGRLRASLPTALILLAGIYLILSPWVVASTGRFGLAASNTITGLALVLLAVGFAWPARPPGGIAWVIPVIGGWVIGSPWAIYQGSGIVPMDILGGVPPLTTAAWLNNVIVGAVVLLAGVVLTLAVNRPVR